MTPGLPRLIDTHCHIQTEEFDADRDEWLPAHGRRASRP